MEDMKEKKLQPVNIIVAGITGAGKSTLINAVFGKKLAETGNGLPVTDHMNEYHNEEIPICIWDTVGLELDSGKTKKSIQDIKKKIVERSRLKNVYEAIHAIWYCINSGSNRYQGAELDFIQELHSIGVPFIIVLTQCIGDEKEVNKFADTIRKENEARGMMDIRIVQVLAFPMKFRGMSITIEPFGLKELVKVTAKKLPDFMKTSFVAAQQIDKELKRTESEKIIYKYVAEVQEKKWRNIPIVNGVFSNKEIVKICSELAGIYKPEYYEEIQSDLDKYSVKLRFIFLGVISPIDNGFSQEADNFFEEMKKAGFKVSMRKEIENCRPARLVALFGYAFVNGAECVWDDSIKDEKKKIEDSVEEIVRNLTSKLEEITKIKIGG